MLKQKLIVNQLYLKLKQFLKIPYLKSMVLSFQNVISKYFSFKELSFPGDNRIAESTIKAGNVQTYPEILCPENKLSKTVRVKGEKKESHLRLPLAKYKTI